MICVDSSTGNQAWKAVTAAICTIFLLTAAVILGVCVYGYRNPQGTVGQWMVRVCIGLQFLSSSIETCLITNQLDWSKFIHNLFQILFKWFMN